MKTSLIYNTCSLDPWASASRNLYRSTDYRARADLLCTSILPSALAQGFDEVIVAGSFCEGEGYRYLHVPPERRDRTDALLQRELGARHATGDILVFSHDDHRLADDFLATLRTRYFDDPAWDLAVPERRHALTGALLNNGAREGYMGGHALVMRRWLWAEVPWVSFDTEWWDRSATRLWTEAGGRIVFAKDLVHLDVEAREEEA